MQNTAVKPFTSVFHFDNQFGGHYHRYSENCFDSLSTVKLWVFTYMTHIRLHTTMCHSSKASIEHSWYLNLNHKLKPTTVSPYATIPAKTIHVHTCLYFEKCHFEIFTLRKQASLWYRSCLFSKTVFNNLLVFTWPTWQIRWWMILGGILTRNALILGKYGYWDGWER